jgi:hypothetical protein
MVERGYDNYDRTKIFRHKDTRDKRCVAKDRISRSILESLDLSNPKDFKAILMPCYWGPELVFLRERGVPAENIFIVERNKKIWSTIRSHPSWGPHLHNVKTSYIPLSAAQAIDFAYAELGRCDFVYLDFFGPPDDSHWMMFLKIFKLRILRSTGKLLVTFGKTRCRNYVYEVNKKLSNSKVPTLAMIRAAIKMTGHTEAKIEDHKYISSEGAGRRYFISTEVTIP